jgi:hypothetical protein
MAFGRGEWARRPPILFAVTCVGVVAVIVAGGWLTDARLTMHAALLVVGAVAFLPLVVVFVGFVVAVLGLLVTALVAAAAEDADVAPVGELGAELMGAGAMATLPYYRRLFRMRRPAVWGGLAGLLLGAITLWGLLALLVIPQERETARRLAAAKVRIDEAYATDGRFPKPGPGDSLLDEGGEVVRDAFDRPLRYEVSGAWKLARYRVVSSGYDGAPSSDDLCVSGSTEPLEWATKIREVAAQLDPDASTGDGFAGIRALRCP